MDRQSREPARAAGPAFEDDASELERRRWLNVLANLPIFDKAAGTTVEELLSNAEFRRHAPGRVIYAEGSSATHAFFLISGTARVFQSDSGRSEYTPKIFLAPTHFGDLASLARLGEYRSSIQALVESVTARVPAGVLIELLERDHGLCLSWLFSVARQHAVTIDSDRQSVFGGLVARMANTFLSYGDAFGVAADGATAIDHPLSYTKLAQHVGCTRRRAITVAQQMARQGLVKSSRDGWLIFRDRLRDSLAPGRLSLAYSLEEKD